MRVSKYVYSSPALISDAHLLYSSRSGALLEFSKPEWALAQRIMNGASVDDADPLAVATHKRLVDNLILVPDDFDEFEAVASYRRHQRNRTEGNWVSLTIAPTIQCNFRCHYCFEEHRAEFMSKETVEDLKRFILAELERLKDPAGVAITWFGGEPLMAPGVIEDVQGFVNKLCETRGLKASRSIITNGYLLTDEIASRLLALGSWELVQITVDGTPLVHDGRRVLVNGKGTYERVAANASNALRRGLPVAIRINIDQSNASRENIVETLRQFAQRGMANLIPTVYLGSIIDSTPECSHMSDAKQSLRAAAESRLVLHHELLRLGFASGAQVPKPQCVLCTADSPTGYTISPRGLLFKCWNEIHLAADRAVGSLSARAVVAEADATRNRELWEKYDPLQKTGCVQCKAMPACMGGCPWEAMRTDADHGRCGTLKFFPERLMQLDHADRLINKLGENRAAVPDSDSPALAERRAQDS